MRGVARNRLSSSGSDRDAVRSGGLVRAAEGKAKGESRKQDLRGLNQQTDEVIGPRFLEVKASG